MRIISSKISRSVKSFNEHHKNYNAGNFRRDLPRTIGGINGGGAAGPSGKGADGNLDGIGFSAALNSGAGGGGGTKNKRGGIGGNGKIVIMF
jgi:hypothetical protein